MAKQFQATCKRCGQSSLRQGKKGAENWAKGHKMACGSCKVRERFVAKKPVSAWTESERIEWGLKEDAIRERELQDVDSQEALEAVQRAVKQRRNQIGASSDQAFSMLIEAQRYRNNSNAK